MNVFQLQQQQTLIPLAEADIPSEWQLLVLAPHPDDFDAIAVSLRQLHEHGNNITVAVLTSGASGVEDSFCNPPTSRNKEETREKEQLASCKQFGLDCQLVSFSNLEEDKEGHPTCCQANRNSIKESIDNVRPDAIFMPHYNDTNPAHQRCFEMARDAVSELSSVVNPVFFLNKDPKTINITPQLYTAFSRETAVWKASLLRCHQSQHQRNLNTRSIGFDYRILSYNQLISQTYTLPAVYAEVFEVIQLKQ